ncbi:hypothetical protein ELE36_15295 [Pseudolysobacter antarcticus]|uniref:Uncharacterized protein n=1 Tax=Pseudolysobacter antarcticus TaxID=2511995 RepID=A0A411HM57_9GAMM|nr:hypothetical protein [Pseudolysobacter antarcticus]QBB71611.1 hypothetical protein ELE36_15295 [Pseudolysobacter antarcticus]
MPESVSSATRPSNWLLAIFTAVMMALALGAMWAMIALLLRHGRYTLAVPIGIAIAQTLRAQNIRHSPLAVVLAVVLTVLASIYAQALFAIGDLAQMIGLTFKDAFVRFDPGFALMLARGRIDRITVIWTALAALLAAFWVWRR